MMKRALTSLTLAAALLGPACARAGQTDNLYVFETRASPDQLAVGGKGVLEIQIKSKPGGHVSAEAPLKATLTAKNVKLSKGQLVRADAQQKPEGPRFEVPFTAETAGEGTIDGEVTFFMCTEKLCERQVKKLSVPVRVQ